MIVDVPGIPLRRPSGEVVYALVDPDDFLDLYTYRWGLSGQGYVVRIERGVEVSMHRYLMHLERGDTREVDHINRVRTDNRRANLRVVSHAVNCENHPGFARTSAHRGVSWASGAKKWRVQFRLGGKLYALGYFDDEALAAARAADFLSERELARSVV